MFYLITVCVSIFALAFVSDSDSLILVVPESAIVLELLFDLSRVFRPPGTFHRPHCIPNVLLCLKIKKERQM